MILHCKPERRDQMFETYDDILTVPEVSEILKIGTTQTYRLLRTKKLAGFKEGKDWKIPKQSLEGYVKQQIIQ